MGIGYIFGSLALMAVNSEPARYYVCNSGQYEYEVHDIFLGEKCGA